MLSYQQAPIVLVASNAVTTHDILGDSIVASVPTKMMERIERGTFRRASRIL